MESWKMKLWENDTTLNYLFDNSDVMLDTWTLPLQDWIYHSIVECIFLYSAITGKDSQCSEALLMVNELEDVYKMKIRQIKNGYTKKFEQFTVFRLQIKINDLLLLENSFSKIIGTEYDVWEVALDTLVKEIQESGIIDADRVSYNQVA